MPNLLAGVSVALQSMLSHQAAVTVTEHNVANASTPGYRRQAVVMKAGPAISSQGATYSMGVGQIGSGVSVDKVKRFSTDFYDTRYRNEVQFAGEYSVQVSLLQQLEAEFAETSDSSLTSQLDGFWSSWQQLASDPSNTSLKAEVVDVARTLTQAINKRALSVYNLQSGQDGEITQRINEINEAAAQIASLNGQISRVISINEQPNDLMDERDALIDRLAALTGAKSSLQSNGEVVVSINGHVLVQDTTSFGLSTQMDAANHNFLGIVWADGQEMIPSSGELAGIINSRDGVLNDQLSGLNTLAAAIISRVNEVHSAGFSTAKTATTSIIADTVTGFGANVLDTGQTELTSGSYFVETQFDGTNWQFRVVDASSNPVSVALSDGSGYSDTWQNIPTGTGSSIPYDTGRGLTFTFGGDASMYSAATVGAGAASVAFTQQQDLFTGTDAFTMRVNSSILANSNLLATAATPNAPGDGEIARQIAGIKTEKLLNGNQDTINEFYVNKTAQFGLALSSARSNFDNHDLVADTIDIQRQSIAGVNLNEEAANLQVYQKAYEAAARLMTVMDEMMNTIINGMGIVGR